MNHETFEALLLEKSKAIYQYLRKLGVKPKDAEDIVQDTLYKALLVIDQLPLHQLTPWLFRVAINQQRDMYRKHKRLDAISVDSVTLIGQKSLDDVILRQEFREQIQEVLETMNPEFKHVLLLKYEYDFSYKDISAFLGIKEETIKTMLYRARNQFKTLYRRNQDESGGL
ncbi:RNA polymerase sigma factor [Microbacteriaceae bacterium 4G12]